MDLPTNGGLRVSLETALSAGGSVLAAAVSPVGVRVRGICRLLAGSRRVRPLGRLRCERTLVDERDGPALRGQRRP